MRKRKPTSSREPRLIPREILFGNPEKGNAQISPDGRYLSYLAPDASGVLQVFVRTIGQKDDRAVTSSKSRPINWYFWSYLTDTLLYLQDANGDENNHIFAVNIKTNTVRDLTPFTRQSHDGKPVPPGSGISAYVIATSPCARSEVLIGLNLTSSLKHDVYRLDLVSGSIVLDTENPGNVYMWTADIGLNIRAATVVTENGGRELRLRDYYNHRFGPWKTILSLPPGDLCYGVSIPSASNKFYFMSTGGTDKLQLKSYDLKSGQVALVAEDNEVDLARVDVDQSTHEIDVVYAVKDKLEPILIADHLKKDYDFLKTRAGEFEVLSRDLANTLWIVPYFTDDGPNYYYLYNRATKQSELLFTNRPKLENQPLVKMQPVSFTSRDGLAIRGYLSLPKVKTPKNLPVVVLVHGGPWGRDTWGFNPYTQHLANRGYAVLQVNFRASTGYGKAFVNAGDREWGAKMHDDLIDGVNWLVAQGIADSARIAIMGGSYGGYATLAGLTFTPDVFAAGVDLFGPSNLISLLNTTPDSWHSWRAELIRRVGDPIKDKALLESRSPVNFVNRVEAPLLIGQGKNDPRVVEAESQQMVNAMRKAGKHVDYVLYSDEGHGFSRPANRLHFMALAEKFLAENIGGRYERMGKIAGHSGQQR